MTTEDNLGRRASDQEIVTRLSVIETKQEMYDEILPRIENKLDNHIVDETGIMHKYIEIMSSNVEAVNNNTKATRDVADGLKVMNEKVNVHEVKLSKLELTNAFVWKVWAAIGTVGLVVMGWIYTYFTKV